MTNPFAGKTPAERNKLIAAIVLGVLALVALYITFGGSLFSSKINIAVKNPTPTPTVKTNVPQANVPTREEIIFGWTTTPVNYQPGATSAPDPGRNIFAFYEPPKPTPYVAPSVTPVIPTPPPDITPPPPTPTPDYIIGYANPQTVYEGQNTFRLEVNGTQFTPDSYIIFNGSPLPTTFISPERLVAEVPANLILSPGPRQLSVSSPDGKYSNQVFFTVQAKPRPEFKYIGLVASRRYNNDTAYFEEPGKKDPTAKRLGDYIGRFQLVSISNKETIFEDKDLGFRHTVPIVQATSGQTGGAGVYPNSPPINPNPNPVDQENIPGISPNIRRTNRNSFPQPNQPNPTLPNPEKKEDVSDEDDGDN